MVALVSLRLLLRKAIMVFHAATSRPPPNSTHSSPSATTRKVFPFSCCSSAIETKKLESFGQARPLVRSPSERERLAGLTPITAQEMRKAKEVLDSHESFPTFFLDSEDG